MDDWDAGGGGVRSTFNMSVAYGAGRDMGDSF